MFDGNVFDERQRQRTTDRNGKRKKKSEWMMNAWCWNEKKNIIESPSKNCNDHRNENYLQIKHNKNKAPTPPTITTTNTLQATTN